MVLFPIPLLIDSNFGKGSTIVVTRVAPPGTHSSPSFGNVALIVDSTGPSRKQLHCTSTSKCRAVGGMDQARRGSRRQIFSTILDGVYVAEQIPKHLPSSNGT